MTRFPVRAAILALAATAALLAGRSAAADPALHHPLYMPAVGQAAKPALQPPPVCCTPIGIPPAGQPAMVNMAYFGGHVQVSPKIYLVFWGWGQAGAFSHTTSGRSANDPDGAAARMSAFIAAIGGSGWTASQTQYYQVSGGVTTSISNPANQLGGIWYDDGNA